MKFEIQKHTKRGIECLERLGVLFHQAQESAVEGAVKRATQTPACTLYSSTGCIPFVSSDLLKNIPNLPNILEIPLPTLMESREPLMKMQKPFDKFIRMNNYLTYLTIRDSGRTTPDGYNEGKKLAVWSKRGKSLITSEMFNELANSLKFDLVECPFDYSDTLPDSKKKNRKAYDRTKHFVDMYFGESKDSIKSEVLMPLIAFNDESLRAFYLQHLFEANYSFKGAIYHGFELDPEKLELKNMGAYEKALKETNSELVKKEKQTFNIYSFAASPDQVVKSVELGFDVFSGSYPFVLTQRGHALSFRYHLKDNKRSIEQTQSSGDEGANENVPPKKRQKLEEGEKESNGKEDQPANSGLQAPIQETFLNLSDRKYFDDFGPLVDGCKCYTCKNFTRSYTFHLLNTKEISAQTLLMIHNMTNYYEFFEQLRKSIESDRFEEFKSMILDQFVTSQ